MTTQPYTVAGILLTGGASRRLGRDKALVELGGRSLAERAAALLAGAATPVIEVGPGRTRLPSVREDPPGSGPLAAMVTGWRELNRQGHSGPVLALAVDMPHVTAALLRHLAGRPGAATAVPTAGGYPQPLCARYGPDALNHAAQLFDQGGRTLKSVFDGVEVAWVEAAEWEPLAGPDAFADVDTPADLARLLEGTGHDGGSGI